MNLHWRTQTTLAHEIVTQKYRRHYIKLAYGWMQVSKQQLLAHVAASGRRDDTYHVGVEHERMVGWIVYVHPHGPAVVKETV